MVGLDGLRGFAAFSVFLSHSNLNILTIVPFAFFVPIYRTLAVGPNSVQILFVLSGFLMAYLHSADSSGISFIQKRYARIFPLYGIIVLALWLSLIQRYEWYFEAIVLFGFALIGFAAWMCIRKTQYAKYFLRILFIGFLALQGIMLFFNLFILPRFVTFGQYAMPDWVKNITTLLTNLTLTAPFGVYIQGLSGVFWSLAPEVYFYLLFPLLVAPLILLGKRYGWWMSAILFFGVIKILFDLDHALVSIASLQSVNVARMSGFAVGVLVGSMYQSQGLVWQKLKKIFGNPVVSILALCALIAIQWGDWAIRDGQGIDFMNSYYFVSSVVIGLVILTAVIPNSIGQKVLGNKALTFLGLISFSIYLIHPETIDWTHMLLMRIGVPVFRENRLSSSIYLVVAMIVTCATALFLYWFIERLYFMYKSKKSSNIKLSSTIKKTQIQFQMRYRSWQIVLVGAGVFLFFLFVYSGIYSPTQLLSRHPVAPRKGEVSLLDSPLRIPITTKYPRLSAMVIDLRYVKDAQTTATSDKKKPATLIFRLYDKNNKKIFESERNAYQVAGAPRFPFGTPVLQDANKAYIMELSLKNGTLTDQVLVNTSSTSLVSVYTNTRHELTRNPFVFVLNRTIFVFTNPGFIFAALFTFFTSLFLLHLSKQKRIKQ